jgi:hypothetical protein
MDDNDQALLEALKRLQELENPNKKIFYIYYDDTGTVKHVRNYLETDVLSYIEIPEGEIDFSKFNPDDYCVSNDNNQMKLVKLEKIFDKIMNVKDIIYEIPKVSRYEPYEITDEDVIVEQNSWNSHFKIMLSKKWIDMFGHLKNLRKNITLYVTAEQDPNILYKILNVPIEKLIDHPVVVKYDDFIDCSCSVYGTKYFEKYIHIHYS